MCTVHTQYALVLESLEESEMKKMSKRVRENAQKK